MFGYTWCLYEQDLPMIQLVITIFDMDWDLLITQPSKYMILYIVSSLLLFHSLDVYYLQDTAE